MALDEPFQSVPKTLSEARGRNDSAQWMKAVSDEIKSLEEKGTWEIVPMPLGAKVIDSKFVFAQKRKADRTVDKYKARLVAKGFQEGYVEDVYAPVVDFSTVRLLLTVMSSKGGIIHQMDVKSAFLNGKFDTGECIYLNPPDGINLGLKPGPALKMLKAM